MQFEPEGDERMSRWFSRTPDLAEIDMKLRLGIFGLLVARFQPSWGDRSKLLGAAILNWALVESPTNDEAELFFRENAEEIKQEAMNCGFDPTLSTALGFLYTLTLVRLGRKAPERSTGLADRASELGIIIPDTSDICKPRGRSVEKDAKEFLRVLDEWASELLRCSSAGYKS
jgi:hypothetical protein